MPSVLGTTSERTSVAFDSSDCGAATATATTKANTIANFIVGLELMARLRIRRLFLVQVQQANDALRWSFACNLYDSGLCGILRAFTRIKLVRLHCCSTYWRLISCWMHREMMSSSLVEAKMVHFRFQWNHNNNIARHATYSLWNNGFVPVVWGLWCWVFSSSSPKHKMKHEHININIKTFNKHAFFFIIAAVRI